MIIVAMLPRIDLRIGPTAMNDLPNLLESVPAGSALVALATLSGVIIAGGISYLLDFIRELRSKKQRRTTASIAAADSLDEFQRICVDKAATLIPKSASVSDTRENLEKVRLPDLTLRHHPEFFADLPDAEQRGLLNLLRQTRDQNSRLDALYHAWRSEIADDEMFILKASIEKYGFAEAAQKASLIQNTLSKYTDWPANKTLIEETESIKREAAQVLHKLAQETAKKTILTTIDLFALIHEAPRLFGENKSAVQKWLKTIYGPLFGDDICDGVEKAATKFHEAEEYLKNPEIFTKNGSFKYTIGKAATESITESEIGNTNQYFEGISPEDLDGIRVRISKTCIPEEFPGRIKRDLEKLKLSLMRDTVADPRKMFNPAPKNHRERYDRSSPSGQ